MGSYYFVQLMLLTAHYKAEDSCCQITFRRTVRLSYVALRVAGSKFGILCSWCSLPSMLYMPFPVTKEPTLEQYVGGAERTTPMEAGSKAVLCALALIKNRIATTLGKEVPFNEVLSAAYMEKQKMTVCIYTLSARLMAYRNECRSSTVTVSVV